MMYVIVPYDLYRQEFFTYEYLAEKIDVVKKFLKEHPFPKSNTWINKDEFLEDILYAEGPITLDIDETEEFKQYIQELLMKVREAYIQEELHGVIL